MGPDRDSEELIDAVGKKKAARECPYDRDDEEDRVIRKKAAAWRKGERRSIRDMLPEQAADER